MSKIYNSLPVPTYRWAKVNHCLLEDMNIEKGLAKANWTGAISVGKLDLALGSFTGANEELLKEVLNSEESYLCCSEEGETIEASLHYEVTEETPIVCARLQVVAKKNSKVTLYLTFDGDVEVGYVNFLTALEIGEGATVKVVKTQLHGQGVRHIEHRYVKVEETGRFEAINAEMGATENLHYYTYDLIGRESEMDQKTVYLGSEGQKMDFSYIMLHKGEKSMSNVLTTGALMEGAKKTFRGTIDFQRGARRAEGAEEDVCLLLDDTVHSVSLPLLLCKEDDVSGNHAASAGQIDRDKLFYLMSRGFSEQEAKHIIVESNLRPVIDLVGDEVLENRILQVVRQKMDYCCNPDKGAPCHGQCKKRFPYSK